MPSRYKGDPKDQWGAHPPAGFGYRWREGAEIYIDRDSTFNLDDIRNIASRRSLLGVHRFYIALARIIHREAGIR